MALSAVCRGGRGGLQKLSAFSALSALRRGGLSPALAQRGLCAVHVLTPALLELRQRHRGALQSLEHTLVDIDAAPAHVEVLRESLTLLDSLFLCCVVGEFNAGKSALINALLGRRACPEGVLPTTTAVTLLKHPDVAFEPRSARLDYAAAGGAAGLEVVNVPGVLSAGSKWRLL